MTMRNVGVRLSVRDGERVKAELRQLGQDGQRALQLIERGAQPASAGLRALDGVANDVGRQLESLGGRAGIAGSALSRMGPAGIAAAAAIGAITAALSVGSRQAAENERVYLRLEQVLTRTGRAAGQTAGQIRALAREQARASFTGERDFLEAAAALATFPNIGGQEFRDALRVAQDLSALYGGDLRSNIESVGRALEDPIAGFTRLRQQGFSLTNQQRELVESFIAVGDTAAAQRVVLDSLNEVVAGASEAEAGGLAGAANRAKGAFSDFAEEMAIASGAAGTTETVLDRLAAGFDRLTDAMRRNRGEGDVGQVVASLTRRQFELRDQLEQQRQLPFFLRSSVSEGYLESEIERLEGLVQAAIERGRQEVEEIDAAEAGRRQALIDQRTEAGFDRLRELGAELDRLATPAERLDLINRGLGETVTQLEALRTEGNTGAIDEAIAAAEEIARRQIDAIERPAREATQREAERTRQLIDQLAGSLERFGDERAEFVARYVSRVADSASPEERARVEALANSLFDLQQQRRAAGEADREAQRIAQEGESVTRAVRTAGEEYADTLADLDRLLAAAAISQETYARAADQAAQKLERLEEIERRRALAQASDPLSGAIRALEAYSERAGTVADTIEQSISRAFQGAEDAVAQFVSTGRVQFGQLVSSILADLARLAVRQAVLGPLSRGIQGAIANAFEFHSGGKVGAGGRPRAVPAAAFAMAPRFHNGGGFGLAPDEQAAILQRGERVLNRRETREWEQGMGTQVIIQTRDAESFRASRAQVASDIGRAVAYGRRAS